MVEDSSCIVLSGSTATDASQFSTKEHGVNCKFVSSSHERNKRTFEIPPSRISPKVLVNLALSLSSRHVFRTASVQDSKARAGYLRKKARETTLMEHSADYFLRNLITNCAEKSKVQLIVKNRIHLEISAVQV